MQIARDSTVIRNIGTNQVNEGVNQYYTQRDGKIGLFFSSVTSRLYTMVGISNTSVNFYNSSPTQVTYTTFDKNVNGVTSSRPGGQRQFEPGKNGLPVKEITSDGGHNTTYIYDDKGNFSKIEF